MNAWQRGSRTALHTLALSLGIFLVFRGALVAFDYVGLYLMPKAGNCRPQWAPMGPEHEFWNGFFRWDGGWYRSIVLNGYTYKPGGPSSVAFYPLYPYLSRWLGRVIGSPFAAGLLLSNAAAVGGIYYLFRLGEQFYDDATTERSVVFLLLFPTSFFLSAFYTEGLFFFLSVGSMAYFYRGRYVASGFLGGLSMLTRSSGLVLFLALALDLGYRLVRGRDRFRPSMLGLLLIPAGLGAFMLLLDHEVGDPLAFMKVMDSWGRQRSWPWVPIVEALQKLNPLLPPRFEDAQHVLDAATALGFLGIGTLMALARFPVAMWTMVVLGTLMPLTTYNIASMGRYVLSLFPAFFWLSAACRYRPRLERFLLFASTFFLALYGLRFMRCGWAG